MADLEAGVEFGDETFEGLDCRGKTLSGKEFNGCAFIGVSFAEATLLRCKLIECTFQKCDFSNTLLKSSTLRDVVFEDSKLLGVNWTVVNAATHMIFRRSVLSLGNFNGMDLRKWVLSECVARELELGHTNLTDADCRGTDFSGSRFHQCNLTKADFRDAFNYAIRPADNVLKQARFSLPEATSLLYGLDLNLDG